MKSSISAFSSSLPPSLYLLECSDVMMQIELPVYAHSIISTKIDCRSDGLVFDSLLHRDATAAVQKVRTYITIELVGAIEARARLGGKH